MSSGQGDGGGIVDVERRKGQAEYTLGDPTVFPPEFLSWLKRFIEQSGIQLPASSIYGVVVGSAGSLSSIAPGVVIPYAGATPPPGSLPCDGSVVSKAAYPRLWDAIGAIWGAATPTTFTLPDLRGRALYGDGGALALGVTDGRALVNRSPSHRHSFSAGFSGTTGAAGNHSGHASGVSLVTGYTFTGAATAWSNGNFGGAPGDHSHSFSGSVSGNTSGLAGATDSPSHAVVTYVITTG